MKHVFCVTVQTLITLAVLLLLLCTYGVKVSAVMSGQSRICQLLKAFVPKNGQQLAVIITSGYQPGT